MAVHKGVTTIISYKIYWLYIMHGQKFCENSGIVLGYIDKTAGKLYNI